MHKVLQAISNEESQELFNVIAEDKNSYDIVEEGIMTRKQYYLRLAKLVKLDLVKKVGKRYALTTFGYFIYETQLTLVMVITSYNATSANKLPTNEESKVMNQIILWYGKNMIRRKTKKTYDPVNC